MYYKAVNTNITVSWYDLIYRTQNGRETRRASEASKVSWTGAKLLPTSLRIGPRYVWISLRARLSAQEAWYIEDAAHFPVAL